MTGEKQKRAVKIKSAGKEAAYLALGVALLTVCAWIAIPVGSIPVTLQTFAVALLGALYGVKRGTLAVGVYLLMGLVGIPVFSHFQAGVTALLNATGGYLIGFLFDVFLVGLFSNLPVANRAGKAAVLYAGMLVGLLFCYFFGTLWFLAVFSRRSMTGVSVAAALSLCVLPYLLPDAVKLALAAYLGVVLRRAITVRA